MYRHIKEYALRYTDVDAYDNLKISSLLSLLQESACLSADELGFGYKHLSPSNLGFIVVNWYIELKRNIKLGENLIVHTWPLKPKMLIFLRDFELYVGEEKVGICIARWCMVDTKNYKPAPVSAFFSPVFFDGYNTERSVDFSNWKIPAVVCNAAIYSRNVKYSDYDHYFHVNNTKYADFLMDVFSIEELAGKRIQSVQLTYVKQCKAGQEISFYRQNSGNGEWLIEGRVDGEVCVQMRLSFDVV